MTAAKLARPSSLKVRLNSIFDPVSGQTCDHLVQRQMGVKRPPAGAKIVIQPSEPGDGSRAWELVWGRRLLSSVPGGDSTDAWVLNCADPVPPASLPGDVVNPTWTELADACLALRGLSLSASQVATTLQVTPAEVSRLTGLARASHKLRESVHTGRLSPGHARLLTKLPYTEQDRWTDTAVAHRWSVRQLQAAMAGALEDAARREAPDTAAFLSRLGEVLGTRVELQGGQLRMACYSAEEAKGLMERLADGPEVEVTPSNAPMWLCVPAPDNDQLYSLTGHLISE